MENLKHPGKKKEIARKAAEITLKKVKKYEDLSAPNLEEGDKIFKEKTRDLWKHFAVQGSVGKEGLLPFAGDLDAKGALYLLRQAGILSPKNFEVYERTLESKQEEEHPRTELKYKASKERAQKTNQAKSAKVISFIPAGDVLRGAIHLDTGNKEGIVTEEDATAYFDHHGAESDLSSSATQKLYEGLVSLGMLERDQNLEKMLSFITQIDNGTFPHAETYFPVFDKTVIGLQRFISPESLHKFFQDRHKPTDVLAAKDLERYGLKERSSKQKELNEKCKKEIVKLREEGFVVDTKGGGKALINMSGRWPGDYLAAKYFKCNTYVIWSPEQQSFFVSNNEDGLELNFPQGVNVRGKMWIKPRTDGKPLEISLKDIIDRIAPPDFKPQGELAKYLESEDIKSYNSKDMNPERIKKSKAKDSADVPTPPKSVLEMPTEEQVKAEMNGAEQPLKPLESARNEFARLANERQNGKFRELSEKYFHLDKIQPTESETADKERFLQENPEYKKILDDENDAWAKYRTARDAGIAEFLDSKSAEFSGKPEEESYEIRKKYAREFIDKDSELLYKKQDNLILESLNGDRASESELKNPGKTAEKTELAPDGKSRIETAREAYLTAKAELDAKKESMRGFENLDDAQKAEHFEIDPNAKRIMKKFNLSKEEYFSARGEDLGRKLEELEAEFKSKGMSEEEYSKEMKKASSAYLVSEFKKVYDARTEMMSAGKKAETPWLMKKLYEVSDEYRRMSWKNKLAISAALIGTGVAAGAVGGTVGAALAAIATGGKLSQRFLSSAGFTIAAEAGIKHQQKGEFEAEENLKFGEVSEKVLGGSAAAKKDELLGYLKSRDNDLESMGWGAEKDIREVEKSLANRRWLFSGAAGLLLGSGLAAEAVSNVGKGLGYLSEQSGLSKLVGGLAEKFRGAPSPVPAHEAIAAVAKEANRTVTIEKGGSVSQAAHTLVKEGKLSMDQFRKAWDHSFVDVKGVKVPIKDISLVHSGDQVVYVPEAGGAGHFEVIDYAKDKFGLGTNQDLYAMYEAPGKEAPVWLQKAVAEDISSAFKDNNLDANDIRVIEFHHLHGSLNDQLEIEKKLFDGMSLPKSAGKPFSDLFVRLSGSPEHARAVRIFGKHLSQIGFGAPDSKEFEAIKNVKVGDLLDNRGRSWFKDYFFSSELVDKNGSKVSKVGIGLQRKLVEYIKSLVSSQDRKLTVEQFLQKLS